jgi:hypothetical protein
MQIEGLVEWKGKKVLQVYDKKGLEKCKVDASHSHKGLGASKGN